MEVPHKDSMATVGVMSLEGIDERHRNTEKDSNFFSNLNEHRLEGFLCDVVLKAGDLGIEAHKIILSARCAYFRALFRGPWNSPEKIVYTIQDIPPNIMDLIVQYIYMCNIHIRADNVHELLRAANILGVLDLVQCCCDFIEKQLSPNTCISIWRFAELHGCSELHKLAFTYLLHHFEEVVQSPSNDFLNLTMPRLKFIIEQDNLNVRQERIVYEAVMMWVKHDAAHRWDYIRTLLSKVRLKLLNCVEVLIQNIKNSEQLESVFSRDWFPLVFAEADNCPNNVNCPRLPFSLLFAFGGWSTHPSSAIEVYDSRADTWTQVFMEGIEGRGGPRAYHGTVYLNGFIYVIGGFDGIDYFNSVQKFNPVAQSWHQVAPMHSRRCYVSVTELDGLIYALGGFDGEVRLNTGECYEPSTNQWSRIMPMHSQRSDANATTLNSKVYICGGFNGNECLYTAECYDPHTNQWTLIAHMETARSGVGVTAFDNKVFAIGGFDGSNRLQCGEMYNPTTNTWTMMPFMLSPRSNFGIEVMEGNVYVIGGYNGQGTTTHCEYYNLKTNEWCKVQEMHMNRSALSCCVVSGLPNVASYTFRQDYQRTEHSDEHLISNNSLSVESSVESSDEEQIEEII